MGRKSREKKTRIRRSDIIRLKEDSIGLPAGYYRVKDRFGGLLAFDVGGLECGAGMKVLPPFERVSVERSETIDWDKQRKAVERFYQDNVAQAPTWEEIDLPGVSDDENSLFKTTIRALRVQ